MLKIRQRPLVILLAVTLFLVTAILLLVPVTQMLFSSMQAGAGETRIFNFAANLFQQMDLAKADQYVATLRTIVTKLTFLGLAISLPIVGLLLIYRHNGQTEIVELDERWLAISVIILWYIAFNLFFPAPYGDEYVHQGAIAGIYDGNWGETKPLSMIPGYHFLVAVLSEPFGPSLILSRSVTALISIAMLMFYYQAAKNWKGSGGSYATLMLALLPILLPFSTTVYTDAPSMFFIAGALWALTARRYHLSAFLVFLACFVRQSNLVWVAFLLTLASYELWKEWQVDKNSEYSSWKDFLLKICIPQVYGYGVAIIVFLLLIFSLTKGLIWGNVPLNRARPNIAQLYTACFFLLLLWAPVWLNRFQQDILALKQFANKKPVHAIIVFFLVLVLAIILITTYKNFHPWNQFWYYLRNNPLVLMEQNIGWRVVGVLAVFWTIWAAIQFWRTQFFQVELALVGIFTVLSLIPQALVEPRYFIVSFALFNLFIFYTPEQEKRLIIWWAILSTLICTAVIIAHLRYTFIAW